MTENLEIVFWDVQHGSSTYIKTPNGKKIVVDLGSGSYSGSDLKFSPLLHLKNIYKVDQLDHVIITHPHKDHIDDILHFDALNPQVLSRPNLNKYEIIKNIKAEDKEIFDTYFRIDERFKFPVEQGNDITKQENAGGAEIKFFVPPLDYKNINNSSIVTIVSYAGLKILIPGDNEPPSWTELLKRDDFKKAITGVNVLLAPHHGRDSGYCAEIFNYFKPWLTIISDGRFCDTSATDRYNKVTSGWAIHHRNNKPDEERKCLTTRSDGVIVVKIGYNPDETRPFLDVTID